MMGPLALVGGGEWTTGCDFDRDLLEHSGDRRVVVVPSAAAFENPAKVVERARNWFSGLGAEVSVIEAYRRADAQNPSVVAPLRDARFVYVAGGSPMHLRSVLKESLLWTEISARWEDGAVLAGAAEGAAVLCSYMADTRGGAFTVGIGAITTLTVLPRFDHWSDDTLHRTIRLAPAGMPVVGIEDRTALLRSPEGDWSVAGVGGVTIHRDGRRVDLDSLPSHLDGVSAPRGGAEETLGGRT